MKATAISGFGEKGPAAFLVEAGDARLLLDLGRGPDHGRRPDLASVGQVDAVLISHGHGDHVGSLDRLPTIGNPPVYASDVVRRLTRDPALASARSLPLCGTMGICGITVRTGRDGHAPGGVWLHLAAGESLFYSGDFSLESQLFPFDPPPTANLAILDASYGANDEPLDPAVDRLAALAEAGPVLLPAPPAGRGLEMAVRLQERTNLPIALCPAHLGVARTMLDPASAGCLTADGTPRLRGVIETAERLTEDSSPCGIMIAASADGTGGVAGALLRRWQKDRDVTIVFTGHLARGTPAERLVDAGRAEFVRWNVHPRLRDLRALAGQLDARVVMPAFLDRSELGALEKILDDVPLVSSPHIGGPAEP
ncbi:MBL fold metallo-hydrolase [Consotaella aegiceratis]|uniref:MBL fold metallo-hydrolase n=1 Tax=Consotaella aegiceratis TaxID=3097961 RepID=UPI002F413EE4